MSSRPISPSPTPQCGAVKFLLDFEVQRSTLHIALNDGDCKVLRLGVLGIQTIKFFVQFFSCEVQNRLVSWYVCIYSLVVSWYVVLPIHRRDGGHRASSWRKLKKGLCFCLCPQHRCYCHCNWISTTQKLDLEKPVALGARSSGSHQDQDCAWDFDAFKQKTEIFGGRLCLIFWCIL